MGRSQESSNKKDNERKKDLKRKEKEQKRMQRQSTSMKGKPLEEMFAYADGYGNITSTPPDLTKQKPVNSEDIEISVTRQADKEPEDPIRKGIVTFFNDEKGYGFIRDEESQVSIFVHINNLVDRVEMNDKVSFETEMGQKGPIAVKVQKREV